jgi:RNA polymerase sigma-B factor
VPPIDDSELFTRYAKGDVSARQQLIQRYMPLARRLAARYRRSSIPQEDLEQIACLGLIKAVDRFEPARGTFHGFAIVNVTGELKRHFRDKGWGMRVARPLQQRLLAVNAAMEDLGATLGHPPTPRELAEATGLDVGEVVEALDAGQAYAPSSMETPLVAGEEGSASLHDVLGSVDPGYARVEIGAAIGPGFRRLPEREQQILRMRFIEDLTQSEIAGRIGMSQMHVSRLLRRALDTLGEEIDTREPVEA